MRPLDTSGAQDVPGLFAGMAAGEAGFTTIDPTVEALRSALDHLQRTP
jgi:hypothetical protein